MMTEEEWEALEDDAEFARNERKENPEIAMNVLASTILSADRELRELREAVKHWKETLSLSPEEVSNLDEKAGAFGSNIPYLHIIRVMEILRRRRFPDALPPVVPMTDRRGKDG